MLKLRKGSKVPFPEKLSEGYEYKAAYFTANVNADKIEMQAAHFIVIHREPVFFILELPSARDDETEVYHGVVEALHKDVYYIDGCMQEEALAILNKTADLMINDSFCSFGFGCHKSQDEIMVGKYKIFIIYNVVSVYTQSKKFYDGFFERYGIMRRKFNYRLGHLYTKRPRESSRVDTDGKSVYDIPDMLKGRGIYLAEKRED